MITKLEVEEVEFVVLKRADFDSKYSKAKYVARTLPGFTEEFIMFSRQILLAA